MAIVPTVHCVLIEQSGLLYFVIEHLLTSSLWFLIQHLLTTF